MPKSRVRKKAAYTPPPGDRTPVKAESSTHPVYVAIMLGIKLAGLGWLVVNYLAGDEISLMARLGPWNFVVGFSMIIVGLLMTMRWR